jgi:hypothetical protein
VDIDAIRRRLEDATPGPWTRHGCDVHAAHGGGPLFRGRDGSSAERQAADRDAEFVAHAREDVAALLDALETAGRADATVDLPPSEEPLTAPY